ncbi:ribose transport system substrate-binding protein [Microbacterium sp. SORGH_AS 1204]|uniref:substrate-binding domain-containing protein n=1 Tax=Microbacterium sp. SORGH_AS_1204 TaxID=3041785 RepID=UPI00278CFEC4|nr:substrate-binding domain-containing protein [Microbacterium sp. SORGH_AS_1204]MDQ1136250.1 ribose transport system substrate-binding protein [Microbacterium sp. SORGH_AS_1204]
MSHSIRTRARYALGTGALLITTAIVAGCSSPAASSPAGSGGSSDITVAMVTPESTGEFYGAMYCGAKAAAAEQGITLNIQGSPGVSTEEVMQVLQSVLATDPDGLLLTVWDNNAFNSTLEPYTAAGHPLVMPDSFLSDDNFVQSIRTDNYQSSYDAAVQALEDFKITSGKVLIVTDAPGNAVQSSRAEGFRDAIADKSDLDVLEFQYVGGDSAKASQAVSSALAANPDISVVFTTNIGAGTGAANGISTAGSDAKLIGFDTASSQVQELRDGAYDALIGQSPYQMGYESTTLISKILKDEESATDVTEKVKWSPWALVTAENVDSSEIAPYLYSSTCS